MRQRVQIKPAKGTLAWILTVFGMKGLIFSMNRIYVHAGDLSNHRLIRHQLKHIEQMQRRGRLVFLLNYLWYALRHGRDGNPYEVEARQAEQDERIRIHTRY